MNCATSCINVAVGGHDCFIKQTSCYFFIGDPFESPRKLYDIKMTKLYSPLAYVV